MNLVVQTDTSEKNLLDNPAVKKILHPFRPVLLDEPLFLDNKQYHYLTIDDNAPLGRLIDELMQLENIESAYEKPLDFPPM